MPAKRLGPNHSEFLPGGTVRLSLHGGKSCLIDVADFEIVSMHRWCACRLGGQSLYAVTHLDRTRTISMHRLLCPGFSRVDHINCDGLDNRRANLRPATPAQNCYNQPLRKDNCSGFRGASKHADGKWVANIRVRGRQIYLGLFDSPEFAARAYDAAAIRHFGEFAKTNEALGLLSREASA